LTPPTAASNTGNFQITTLNYDLMLQSVCTIDGNHRGNASAAVSIINDTIASTRQDLRILSKVGSGKSNFMLMAVALRRRYETARPLTHLELWEFAQSYVERPARVERPATLRVTVSQEHAAFLIKTRKRFLIYALFLKSSVTKLLARSRQVVPRTLTIIAVFMCHRHRREPADGWLTPRTPFSFLGGVQ
jgi:hypothetical protein